MVTSSSSESREETSYDEFNETKLYIRNIPVNANEKQLKRMFCGYGRISELEIIRGGNRGVYYGFTIYKFAICYIQLQNVDIVKNFYDGDNVTSSLASN